MVSICPNRLHIGAMHNCNKQRSTRVSSYWYGRGDLWKGNGAWRTRKCWRRGATTKLKGHWLQPTTFRGWVNFCVLHDADTLSCRMSSNFLQEVGTCPVTNASLAATCPGQDKYEEEIALWFKGTRRDSNSRPSESDVDTSFYTPCVGAINVAIFLSTSWTLYGFTRLQREDIEQP